MSHQVTIWDIIFAVPVCDNTSARAQRPTTDRPRGRPVRAVLVIGAGLLTRLAGNNDPLR